jgi:Ca-activated chloride channel family protein
VSFAFDYPWWLFVLVLIVPSAVVGWGWMSGVPKGRRIAAISIRSLLIALLAFVLAGLQRVHETDRVAVVAVLDVSGSIRSFADFGLGDLGSPLNAEDAYRSFLDRASADKKPDDLLGVVVFDGQATAAGLPARSGAAERILQVPETSGTNIASAIARARAILPADVNARLVVISDGRSTAGDLDAVETTTPIDVVAISYEVADEVVLESVEMPSRAIPESVVDIRVVLKSAGVSRGLLSLFYDGQPVDLDAESDEEGMYIELAQGRQVLTLPVQLGVGRVHRLRAVFEPEQGVNEVGQRVSIGDTSNANNSAAGITITPGHGRILLLDGVNNGDGSGSALVLPDTLSRGHWDVDVVSGSAFPQDLLDLEQYDLVILVNTARDMLSEDDERMLETYTRVLGGGLLFVGGPDALGAGGWRGSELEKILPVKLDVADDVVMPEVAVVIVLDSSGSMRRAVFGSSRTQQTVANESAAGAIDILDPRDQIGVIAFASSPRVVVPIGPNTDPETTRKAVVNIRSDGGTYLVPAMELAREQLDSVEAKTKHVIVLSDGQSDNAQALPGIAQSFGDAGIKVTTIAVGDDADDSTLRQMATRSGGVAHRVINPSRLPRVFLKAIRVVRTPMVREELFTPIVLDPNIPMLSSAGALPALSGLVMTEQIEDPLVSTPIVSDRGEPLLAYHQVELGRVAVFTSDASNWASGWIEDPVFERFWTNLVQWTMRNASEEPGELTTVIQDGRAEFEYETLDVDGAPIDGLSVDAQIFGPDGTVRKVPLSQTGAGKYSGSAEGLGTGVHVVIARPMKGDEPLMPSIAGIEISAAAEYTHLSADPSSLIDLAERTGGRVLDFNNPLAASLFDRGGLNPTRAYTPMWPALILLILLVFLADIAARRVAWDRWVRQARDETLAVTRAVGSSAEKLRATKRAVPAGGTLEIERPKRKKPDQETLKNQAEVKRSEDSGNPLLAAKRRAKTRIEDLQEED